MRVLARISAARNDVTIFIRFTSFRSLSKCIGAIAVPNPIAVQEAFSRTAIGDEDSS